MYFVKVGGLVEIHIFICQDLEKTEADVEAIVAFQTAFLS